MPLSQASFKINLAWALSKLNTGFGSTTEGPDSISFSLGNLNVTTFSQLAALSITLASAATQDVDLTALVNLIGEACGFGRVLAIIVEPVGGKITLSPASANPIQWFFGTPADAVLPIAGGGCFAYSEPAAGPGYVLSGAHKTFRITNTDSVSTTVTIGIIGGP